ncbi:MAG: hypothetical protein JWL83_3325 [Actinomycetia bacterium]|nr:hypothetical protein [Actinomycetes bacterium]
MDDGVSVARLATDDEVAAWRDDGWVLLDGLIGTDEIDAVVDDLAEIFPTAEQYHSDPAGQTDRWIGRPPASREVFTWPETGPGFRPEQHRWRGEFPFPGSGALNRLCVHDAIVDFMQRAMGTTDLRCYQAQVTAKYTGFTNYEQPMHTDRNHSWLPLRMEPPWWHIETFLYLSDVYEGCAPTHLVSVRDSAEYSTTVPLVMPKSGPDLYAAERPAAGVRGSLLAYRTDVFHRAVDLTTPGSARFLLNVSYKAAGQDWIGFHSLQSRANSREWVAFVEGLTPEQLALFGFPGPGHPIWDDALIEETALRYPHLDLSPWRAARSGRSVAARP